VESSSELKGDVRTANASGGLSALLDPEAQEKGVKVLAKAEFLNPGYSIKERIIQHSSQNKGKLEAGSRRWRHAMP